ncbi:MAG: aminoacyl-tRNA hydrolase [Planctomycetota bacterium]|nr:aminoacyl-tRNA hydrolase [Planctomycetota bacterium]
MRFVVGLGNPGREYDGTRHNIGFMVVDRIVSARPAARQRRAFDSHVFELNMGGRQVVIAKPRTFMNLSGRAVAAGLKRLQADCADMLVICDDFNLPLGRLRIRRQGSSGGHRGLDSIVGELGTDTFARLRLGIGLRRGADPAEYVLEEFAAGEKEEMENMVESAAQAVACWVREGVDACMNRFNG